ncbi:MAG: DNA polymerase III subunit gamma/tau [Chitinophagales bacterium]
MSEAFIVSARKYRPQRFDEVVGQEATTQTLKNAIRNKQLAHSFLFTGSRGIGKTTIARIFAKTINCKELQADGEACNQCDACLSFNRNASFNIIELDAASKNSVDDIRDLIEQVQYAPQNAEYKVFIIDEVHMLSPSAFNAFLKTLEEPPSYAKFILATTEKHKILPTILSRCQIYDFKRISIEDIQKHLKKIADKESIEADDNSLNLIAQKADGGLRDALSMFDRLVSMNGQKLEYTTVVKSLNILDHVVYFQFIEQIVNEKSDGVLLQLNEVLSNGFDLEVFLSGLAEHIRHLWVAKKETTLSLLEFNAEVKSQFVAQSKELDEAYMLNLLQIISECEVQMKTTRNRRLAVELALLKMCYTKKLMQTSWTELGEKKKSDSLVHSSKPR